MDLTVLIAFANVVGGIISALAALANVAWMRSERRAAEEASDTLKFAEAMRSDNISQLGGYLESTIGGLLVVDYASDIKVKRRIDEYLDRIVDFLNSDVAAFERVAPHEMTGTASFGRSEFARQIMEEIDRGEVWNSLAKLRRYIELSLRRLAELREIEVGERVGAGHLISRLEQSEALDRKTGLELRQVVGLANRAIHGEDVPTELARQAVLVGLSAISRIAGTQPS